MDNLNMLTQLRTELAQTETKEQQLRDAIRALERLSGQGDSIPDPNAPRPFKNATYGDAAQALLTEHGPKGSRELAEMMLKGGISTRSRNFVATLYTVLQKDGRFKLIDRVWHIKGKGGRG